MTETIRPAALREPQTARVARYARPWHESALSGLKPATVAAMLREADAGNISTQARLFADMQDRDAMIAAAMQQRALAIARLPRKIEPPKDASTAEKRAAEAIAGWMDTMNDAIEDAIAALMDAVGHGFSAIEIVWDRGDGL